MLPQDVYAGVPARQFALGEQRVDLAMTDAMQEFRPTPAIELGHLMIEIALRRRDRALAQRVRHGGRLSGGTARP